VIDEHNKVTTTTREFKSFQEELLKLKDWLLSEKCEIAAMESTSVYWRSTFEALEAAWILVVLVNARHVKGVPGRKTDIQDSEWLATLAAHGLLRPSFIPPRDIREIRLLTRYRRKIGFMMASEKNRLQKILDDSGVRLGCVVSDIDGVSARKMIDALIENKSGPDEIAKMAVGSLKKKEADLAKSLVSKISDRHRVLMTAIKKHIDVLKLQLSELDSQIETAMQCYRVEWQLLQTVPGIDKIGAAMLLAEVGVDMASFGNSERLCSWAGVSPGNNQSAGKRKSGKTNPGNVYLKSFLCEAANSAKKTNSQFKSRYESLVIRRGHKKATMALAHKILEVAFILIKKKVPYQDPNIDYDKLVVDRNAPRWLKMLEKYGYLKANKEQESKLAKGNLKGNLKAAA
jgi:transposase